MEHLNSQSPMTTAALPRAENPQDARVCFERLASARSPLAFFLDIDGTLIDVAPTPSSVHVPPDLAELLSSLSARLSGALAIVTGRTIAEADRLLKPLELAAAGVHGAEMRVKAGGTVSSLTPTLDDALKSKIITVARMIPGVVVEDKGTGVAVHYRLAPESGPSLIKTVEALAAERSGQLRICKGRMVVEILPSGISKGSALRRLAALPPFAKRVPVMVGDDVTDVEAFRAAEELGGFGLSVAGENFHESEATFRSPSEVLAWLKAFCERR
jgi:trehalose 6-phosphate phosphatase